MTELQARDEFDTNTDGHVSEEEITLLIGEGIDYIDLDMFISLVWPKIKDTFKMPVAETPEPIEAPPTEAITSPEAAEEDDDADFEEVCMSGTPRGCCVNSCNLEL